MAAAEQTKGAIFDIGANFGLYSLLIATGLRRHVLAFEPFPEPANVLRGIALHEDLPIEVNEVGISDSVGASTLYISDRSDMSNSLNSKFRNHKEKLGILTTTIDAVSKRVAPGQIKIDIETMELFALRGARETLKRDSPNLMMEALDDTILQQIEEILLPLDYKIIQLGGAEFCRQFDINGFDATGDERNILAVKDLNDSLFLKRTREWMLYLRKL